MRFVLAAGDGGAGEEGADVAEVGGAGFERGLWALCDLVLFLFDWARFAFFSVDVSSADLEFVGG